MLPLSSIFKTVDRLEVLACDPSEYELAAQKRKAYIYSLTGRFVKVSQMRKGALWMVVIIMSIALFGFFLYAQLGVFEHEDTDDSSLRVTEGVDHNSPTNTTQNQTAITNASNRGAVTIPLEKPPFIE